MSYAKSLMDKLNVDTHNNKRKDRETKRLRHLLEKYEMMALMVHVTNEARRVLKKANDGVMPTGMSAVVWNIPSNCDPREKSFIIDAYMNLVKQAYKVKGVSLSNLLSYEDPDMYYEGDEIPSRNEMVKAMVDYIPPALENCEWEEPITVHWE